MTLQQVCDYAKTFSELTPVLGTGGYSTQPALTIANDVMTAMLSQAFPWKWNRMKVAPFYTNSWQQDYAVYGVTNLAWIEHCWIIDINNTAIPKPIWSLEAVRDLERTSNQYGRPGQVCWLPNDQLNYGVYGGSDASAGNNPETGSTYTNPIGAVSTPDNPIAQILDTNGNYEVVDWSSFTGSVQIGAEPSPWPPALLTAKLLDSASLTSNVATYVCTLPTANNVDVNTFFAGQTVTVSGCTTNNLNFSTPKVITAVRVLHISGPNSTVSVDVSSVQANIVSENETTAYLTIQSNAGLETHTGNSALKFQVVDPKGQGFRLNPIPPQSGVVYQVNVVAQKRPPVFTSLSDTLDPIPDDFAAYFRQGFVTHCYRHSPEAAVRAKFASEYQLWMKSLMDARGAGDRERDEAGFYPNQSIMSGYWDDPFNASWPYPPGS